MDRNCRSIGLQATLTMLQKISLCGQFRNYFYRKATKEWRWPNLKRQLGLQKYIENNQNFKKQTLVHDVKHKTAHIRC